MRHRQDKIMPVHQRQTARQSQMARVTEAMINLEYNKCPKSVQTCLLSTGIILLYSLSKAASIVMRVGIAQKY